MLKNLILILVLIITSCGEYLPKTINNSIVLNGKIIIKDTVFLSKKSELIINPNTNLIIKKNSVIVNNGGFIKLNGSIKDTIFINSKNNFKIILKNKASLNVNFCYLNNVSIIIKDSDLKINNSNILSSYDIFNIINSNVKFNNCYLMGNKFNYVGNFINSNFILNNSIINNFKTGLIFNNSINYNLNISNSLFKNIKKETILIKKSFNNYMSNCVFYKNNIVVKIKNKENVSLKIINNLFINNNIIINNNGNTSVYLLNNTIHNNKLIINNNYNGGQFISKNNIFYNNNKLFKLKDKTYLNNSFCLYNTDTLIGYYNLKKDPLFKNTKSFNYILKDNSPAIGSANNNTNIGANINNIYMINYLNK
jgi:hypothetical protein